MLDWKRNHPVDIKKYLPHFLAKDNTFNAINNSDNLEHERIRLLINDMLDQLFVESATWGLKMWEDMLGIIDTDSDIRNRRIEILIRLNSKAASTPKFLESLANRWVVDKSANIVPYNEKYTFTLNINKDKCYDLKSVTRAIDMYKPAHLGWNINEIATFTSNIVFVGTITESSNITILQGTNYNIEPLANSLKFAGGIFISTNTFIGGKN